MNMRHDFRLAFYTNRNETLAFTVPRANSTLGGDAVAAAMNGIMNSSVVRSPAGTPVRRQGAELVTTEYINYDIFQ